MVKINIEIDGKQHALTFNEEVERQFLEGKIIYAKIGYDPEIDDIPYAVVKIAE